MSEVDRKPLVIEDEEICVECGCPLDGDDELAALTCIDCMFAEDEAEQC